MESKRVQPDEVRRQANNKLLNIPYGHRFNPSQCSAIICQIATPRESSTGRCAALDFGRSLLCAPSSDVSQSDGCAEPHLRGRLNQNNLTAKNNFIAMRRSMQAASANGLARNFSFSS
jgi:hypothetical protein